MTVTKEIYVDIEEKFTKIVKLMEDSKNDPPNDPYRSNYSARQLLIGVKANVENLRRSQPVGSKEYLTLTALLSLSLLYLAKIASDTEEVTTALKHINKCLETIDKLEQESEFVIIAISILNLQALLSSNNEPELSKSYLEKSISIYKEFKTGEKLPISLSDLFKVDTSEQSSEDGFRSLEKAHILTLYYLAQIYGTLKDSYKSSIYLHVTLKHQLRNDDYDHIDWSLNAATLSQYFIETNSFRQARHHLAASLYVLQKYEDILNAQTLRNDEYAARIETFKHRSADVARCWAKYGLALLATSRERLLKHADDEEFEVSTDFANLDLVDSNISQDIAPNLEFDLDLVLYENQISTDFLLTLEDARAVFLNVKSWLAKAHEYYTLNSLASDYIEIVQDQSQMYLNLLFYEDDPTNQAKLHKRRSDLLEEVLKEINPTYYMVYCRQLWFEAAEINRDIYYIKMEKIKELKGHPAPHMLSKINNLLKKAIQHYNAFIKSFEDGITKELPKVVDSSYEKTFLLAFFNIGALSNRFITLDKQLLLENTQATLSAYRFVVEYCDRRPEAADAISAEVGICREMVALLPVKIAKLTDDLQH